MKISVVTPSFNQGQFIGRCLESIRNQKGKYSIEHIVLDNCSTDSTVSILDEYKKSSLPENIRIIVEPDEGQTAAINKGFSLASGDIVCWLNTDEWYYEGALAKVADYFAAHPEVDVVFGNCSFVDTTGKVLKEKREYFYSESMLLYYGCFIPSCSTFVRRTVIDKGVVLDPQFRVTMDFDWYVRIAKSGFVFVFLKENIAAFTWHETNISSIFVERRKEERLLVQETHSSITGPVWLRKSMYEILRYYWTGVRIMRRFIG